MRAVAYIRVSDLSQVEGYSLDAQERLFLQHCKTKEWTPIQVYREEGRSAHSDSIRKRPVFRQLLEGNCILHTDRLRNLVISHASIPLQVYNPNLMNQASLL